MYYECCSTCEHCRGFDSEGVMCDIPAICYYERADSDYPNRYVRTLSESDLVNHPDHYISETGLETIDVIEAFTFDLKGIEATDTGNILKYMCRWKQKNGLQDLEKAQWYLNHLIAHVKKLEKENNE